MRWDLRWRLKLYREEQFLMEVGPRIEFHVAGELKALRPKSVDGTWRSFWVEERRAVVAGVLGGEYKDRMVDRLPRSYRQV